MDNILPPAACMAGASAMLALGFVAGIDSLAITFGAISGGMFFFMTARSMTFVPVVDKADLDVIKRAFRPEVIPALPVSSDISMKIRKSVKKEPEIISGKPVSSAF